MPGKSAAQWKGDAECLVIRHGTVDQLQRAVVRNGAADGRSLVFEKFAIPYGGRTASYVDATTARAEVGGGMGERAVLDRECAEAVDAASGCGAESIGERTILDGEGPGIVDGAAKPAHKEAVDKRAVVYGGRAEI